LSVKVTAAGVLEAMAAGLGASTTALVAFTDDDAIPRPDWVERLEAQFIEPDVGAAGGRDLVGGPHHSDPRRHEVVGRLSRWGRLQGNHHIGQGSRRDVDVLKSVNCMYRREAIALPRNLRGAGAQVHFEVAMGLWAASRGWRLVYDPETLVDHYPGPRHDLDQRDRAAPSAIFDASYNLTFAIGSLGAGRALRRIAYALVVGDRSSPGVLRALASVFRPGDRRQVLPRLSPAMAGSTRAALDLLGGGRLVFFENAAWPRPSMSERDH
jgi:hypothetical protein